MEEDNNWPRLYEWGSPQWLREDIASIGDTVFVCDRGDAVFIVRRRRIK